MNSVCWCLLQPGPCISRPAHITPESGPSAPSAREGRQSPSWHLPRGALPAPVPQNRSYWSAARNEINSKPKSHNVIWILKKLFVFLWLGPYMLGTGLLIYMLSKEIYVINHETFAAASIGAVIVYGIKKFGPDVAAFADKLNEVGRKRHKWHRCIAKYFCCPQKLLLSSESKMTLIQFKIIFQIDAKQ